MQNHNCQWIKQSNYIVKVFIMYLSEADKYGYNENGSVYYP